MYSTKVTECIEKKKTQNKHTTELNRTKGNVLTRVQKNNNGKRLDERQYARAKKKKKKEETITDLAK